MGAQRGTQEKDVGKKKRDKGVNKVEIEKIEAIAEVEQDTGMIEASVEAEQEEEVQIDTTEETVTMEDRTI